MRPEVKALIERAEASIPGGRVWAPHEVSQRLGELGRALRAESDRAESDRAESDRAESDRADKAAKAEREACAKVLDLLADQAEDAAQASDNPSEIDGLSGREYGLRQGSFAIRARTTEKNEA